mgnify:CR=1 FL=1
MTMSAPIQKSVVYQAAIKIFISDEEKFPDSLTDYKVPGTDTTYRMTHMRDCARLAWEMVEAVNYTEPMD